MWSNGRNKSVSSSFSDLKHRHLRRKDSIDTTSITSEALPPVHYYQDPEARDLLKTYLASPAKWDEVLDLGFPSDLQASPEDYPQRVVTKRARVHNSSNDAQLFLRDGSFSFLSDPEESDEDSNTEEDISSSSPTFSSSGSASGSVATHSGRPASINFKPWGMGFGWPGERQMTLRITLTRPELRASDQEIYGMPYTDNSEYDDGEESDDAEDFGTDPLALPSLHEYEEDMLSMSRTRTANSASPVRKSTSLWRKVGRTASTCHR